MSDPRIVRVVLDRPDRANALDPATVERLHVALTEADDADVIVLEARGRSFCAGLDLADVDDETDATLLLRLVRVQLLLERVRDSRALVVAVVQGAAVGAGADLVLAAHVRLALPGASLRFPGSGFGAVLGTSRLAAETSASYAAELGLTGRRVDRADAAAAGIWSSMETLEDVEARLDRLAASSALLPGPTGVRLRAAAAGSSSRDPLGDLVRSLASEPGLADRVRAYRHRSLTRTPEGASA
ncbi:MAG: enoyl-CoA hydratase/isomerase family protein [Nocardioides sp.]